MSIQTTPFAASGLNRLLVDRGNREIPALENVAPADLRALQEGLARFDEVAKDLSKNPVFGAIANAESLRFVRDLARTVSAHADPRATPASAEPLFTGMCGGGGGGGGGGSHFNDIPLSPPPPPPAAVAPPPPPPAPVAPPAAQAPPVAAQPPAPAAPPVVAQPPAPTRPNPTAPTALGGGRAQALGQAGSVDGQSLAQVFGALIERNPMAALMALGALGSLLGSGGFNPLQLNAANNGAQAAAAQGQALAGGGGNVAPPSSTPNTGNAELDAMLAAGGKGMVFEDRVALMMSQIIKKMQQDIEARLEKLKAQAEAAEKGGGKKGKGGGKGGGLLGTIGGIAGNMIAPGVGGAIGGMVGNAIGGGGGGGGGGGAGGSGQESRNIEFEMLKNEMQKLSQMQQAFSNILNAMHDTAKNAIQAIR